MARVVSLSAGLATIDAFAVDLAVLVLCEDDRPFPGAAGDADWRALGRLSSVRLRGRFGGGAAESHLVHVETLPQWERVLLYGLGARARLQPAALASLLQGLGRVIDGLNPARMLFAPTPLPAALAGEFDTFVQRLSQRSDGGEILYVVNERTVPAFGEAEREHAYSGRRVQYVTADGTGVPAPKRGGRP